VTSTAQRTATQRTAAPTAGGLLRHWRQEARRSQLDLASASGVSARHLSFVETGRARPSRSLLLHLAEHLEMPLRERNALVLAAGYAPAYAESDLGADHLRSAREALAHLLAGHEPYPALVLDRWGDVLMTNGGAAPLLSGVDPDLLARPNAYRIGLHPGGLLRRVREPAAWIAHLGQRLTRALRWSGDPRLRELLREIRSYPGVADVLDAGPELGAQELLLTVTLDDANGDPEGELRLHTAVTTFGGPHDVTLAELAVESFFPADARTRARLHAAA
jgi:transcriptional regulator with XRE-family HTH domain